MNLITWKWNFDYKIRYEEQCFSLPFLWIFQYKKVFFLKSNFLYTMDVSRNEESHVSVTTSLFMALVKVWIKELLGEVMKIAHFDTCRSQARNSCLSVQSSSPHRVIPLFILLLWHNYLLSSLNIYCVYHDSWKLPNLNYINISSKMAPNKLNINIDVPLGIVLHYITVW